MIPSNPEVDVNLIAREVKDYINKKKLEHIDYGHSAIEMWPNPLGEETPEMNKFVAQFEAVFVYADSVTGEEGENFPSELVKAYEDEALKVQTLVNEDTEFWAALRDFVLPMYEKSKEYDYWKTRWTSIKFWYDPIGMEVRTSKLLRKVGEDGKPAEIKSKELISSRIIPPGFVIKVL